MKIHAVDFDGVIVQDMYPAIGLINKPIVEILLKIHKRGDKIILNTCRTGELLAKAVTACEKAGIHLDAVNENLPERIEKYGGDTRKISADYYWEDRAVITPFIRMPSVRMLHIERECAYDVDGK